MIVPLESNERCQQGNHNDAQSPRESPLASSQFSFVGNTSVAVLVFLKLLNRDGMLVGIVNFDGGGCVQHPEVVYRYNPTNQRRELIGGGRMIVVLARRRRIAVVIRSHNVRNAVMRCDVIVAVVIE
jgi:hypothetical protein